MAEKMGKTEAKPKPHFDPICGRRVATGSMNILTAEYKQRRYFFCSEKCREHFNDRAEKFRIAELARGGALLRPGPVRWGLA